MALGETLKRFPEQFSYEPSIQHAEALRPHQYVVVCGMGGSHLAPWLIREYGNHPEIIIHRDYGLPNLPHAMYDNALVILSSHSGGTEEVLDAGREALARGLPTAAVSTGGKLIEFAREHALPHVVFPHMNLQPRLATPLAVLAIAAILQDRDLDTRIRTEGGRVDALSHESDGRRIAEMLYGKIPVIYASAANVPLAYMWKIKLNETSKIPAFYNVLPEMNHNELCGFDVVESTRALSQDMRAILLEDSDDHPRVQKRMQVMAEVLAERGIPVERVRLQGNGFEQVFAAAVLADWVTLALSEHYGVPDEDVPLVEDFKRRIL